MSRYGPKLLPSLQFYDTAARRLYDRACTSAEAGRLTVTISTDEARAHAFRIWDLVAALRELA